MLKPGSKIYFLAICGTGMSALAGLLKERGYQVAGSDVAAYPPVGDLLKKLSIPVHLGFDVEDLKKFAPDYVVIGNFIRRDNPQAQYVLDQKISYGSFPSTLEKFFLGETQNIVVVGTHGKTTTTSAVAHLLAQGGLDPSFLVGGVPLNFGQSFHVGKGKQFVIEGDEYDTAFFDKESKFLHYRPTIGIFNSIEFDHADIFPTMEAMEKMFRKFVRLIPKEGLLLFCKDWSRIEEILKEERAEGNLKCRTKSFGFDSKSDVVIDDYHESRSGLEFVLQGQKYASPMSGRFNAQNFAAAILAGQEVGLAPHILAAALQSFQGVKRRQEVVGEVGKHLIIDDFAHHPTAVKRVLEGLRKKYPDHRLVTFFEPRSNTSRRNVLQKDFENCFDGSDLTLIAELFKKETIPEDQRLDLKKVAEAHRQRGCEIEVDVPIELMIQKATKFSAKGPVVFLVLSNGAFDGLHQKLISALRLT